MDRCKGMRDLLPVDMARFRLVEKRFREICLKWGYEEIRTPVLEYLHLFTATGTLTPDMLNRVYSFLDWDGWSGERVVLRPDGTIPAARLFISELKQHQPARLFYIQDVFSFEETGREPREKWQCGAELMGGKPPQADAELIMLGREVLEGLGLGGVELRLAHFGLLRSLVRELGLDEDLLDRVRNGERGVLRELGGAHPELRDALSLLLELRAGNPGFLHNLRPLLLPLLPGLAPHLEDFISIAQLLTDLKCDYTIDMSLSRGFEYYTGIVFHFYCGGVRVGGGGRYDDLIPLLGGERVPASGFALYADRLMPLVAEAPAPRKIAVRAAAPGEWPAAFALAQALREAKFTASLEVGEKHQDAPAVVVEGGPSYVIVGRGRKRRCSSPAQVIRVLGEARDAEVSPA